MPAPVQFEPEGTTRPKRTRNRYPKEVKALLEDYLVENQSTQVPSLPKRQELCTRIKEIPGGEWCTPEGLYRWFNTKIKKASNTSSGEQFDRDPRFPSLSREALDYLGLLIKEHPVPSPQILTLWSGLLEKAFGATGKDVVGWVTYVHELVLEERTNLRSKLPTPQSTATPEPQPQTHDTQTEVQPMKLDPTQSPLLPESAWPGAESPSPLMQSTENPLISRSPSSPISPAHSPLESLGLFTHSMLQDRHPKGLALLSLIEAFAEDPSPIAEDLGSSVPASMDAFAMICQLSEPKLNTLLNALGADC